MLFNDRWGKRALLIEKVADPWARPIRSMMAGKTNAVGKTILNWCSGSKPIM